MNRLRVLTYHRILAREAISPYFPQVVSAYPDEFEKQIAWLSRHYTPVDTLTVLEALESRARLPKRAVLVTFDDGYPDFGETAWPILKAHGVPATLFVPTDYPSETTRPFWWDELSARLVGTTQTRLTIDPIGNLPLEDDEDRRVASARICAHAKTLPHQDAMRWLGEVSRELGGNPELVSTMNWDEIRALAADGVTIGAHSRSHALLTALPPEALGNEIAGSREDLDRELGSSLPIFCYPAGAWNDEVEKAAENAGIRLAFTTQTGHNDLDRTRPLALRRLNITPRTTQRIFRLKLSVAGGFADRVRKRVFH